MINFYYVRVVDGQKKWTEIPAKWREGVKELLIENGWTLNEDGTVSR